MEINETTIHRMNQIREKVDNELFNRVISYFRQNETTISKDSFDIANKHIFWQKQSSYCSYILFLQKYFLTNKIWK